jgi:CubicO group peptidase (beta-lactamase class C family)
MELSRAIDLSNDPRFLSGVIPSANVISTARDASAFFQCLLQLGEHEGRRIFDRRTVQHAIDEQAAWEIDLTLGMPISYGLGFMLGNRGLSLYGWNHPRAFGHLGLTNVFCWADPDRALAVALLTTGKPVLSLHALRMADVQTAIHETFPEIDHAGDATSAFH